MIDLGNGHRAAAATLGPCSHLGRRPTDQQQMPIPRANDLASDVCLVVHSSIVDRESANWVAACNAQCAPYSSYGRVVFRAAPADRFAQLQRPKSHRRYLSSRSLSPAGSIEVSFAPGVIVRHAPTPHAIAPRRTAR